MNRNEENWAVFWCALLSPLLVGEIPAPQREAYFQKLSQEERLFPNGQRKRVSVRTLRRKWQRWRKEGVPGLFRRRRADRGRPRKKQADLLARALELKKEQPYRSDRVINPILGKEFGRQVPRSTLYHHLRREGATRRKLGLSKEKIRCRWTRDQSNALWVGDFEHGPLVVREGVVLKTHLAAWIDCHSRYLVAARYYLRENLDILVDSLLRAWGQHGASRELYVDNGKVFHANALKLACAQLNILLLHRPPRDPPAGGLIERFFETVQGQLEAEIRAAGVIDLDELNRLLAAWLATAYHLQVHSQTGQTPHQRYHDACRFTRHVDLSAVLSFFHRQEERVVNEDFADVRIDDQFFAVDAKLRGDKVLVRYDPYAPLEEVQLFSLSGAYLGIGRRYQREKREPTQPPPAKNSPPIEPHYLNVLRADHQKLQQQQREQGIDYHSARQRNVWSLASFARQFARLLGRAGGLSGLSAAEMETLRAFHVRYQNPSQTLTETLLRQAFERAESPSIPLVLFQLQFLLSERNP